MTDFRYDELVQKALISLVREVLDDVAKYGLSDNHHFYVRFRTDHPKTKIPSYLKKQYPEEIMIVLQHQFWNLKTFEDRFCVDLSFNGCQETLVVPFAALTAFVDPSVKFVLQFTPSFASDDNPTQPRRDETSAENNSGDSDGKIISFESFRRK